MAYYEITLTNWWDLAKCYAAQTVPYVIGINVAASRANRKFTEDFAMPPSTNICFICHHFAILQEFQWQQVQEVQTERLISGQFGWAGAEWYQSTFWPNPRLLQTKGQSERQRSRNDRCIAFSVSSKKLETSYCVHRQVASSRSYLENRNYSIVVPGTMRHVTCSVKKNECCRCRPNCGCNPAKYTNVLRHCCQQKVRPLIYKYM